MESLRNLGRRRLRSFLTIAGIGIGMFALSLLGAMAERMNAMIAGSMRFFTAQISIVPAGPLGAGAVLTPGILEAIRAIDGVQAVHPMIVLLIGEDAGFTLGIPPMIRGVALEAGSPQEHLAGLPLRSGRMLRPGERGAVVLGADLAGRYDASPGSLVWFEGRPFEVVGVLQKTLTGPDSMAILAIEDARELLWAGQPLLGELREQAEAILRYPMAEALLPPALRQQWVRLQELSLNDAVTAAGVAWEPGTDPERLAGQIRAAVPGVQVFSPAQMAEELAEASLILNLIILGSGMIALLVGGLSVVNTMTTAVTERTAEIGLKKALGATDGHILREYLAEAALIGVLGGFAGLAGAGLAARAIHAATAASGVQLFLFSPRLVLGAFLFSTLLGMCAGLYPAVRAAHLAPIDALRRG